MQKGLFFSLPSVSVHHTLTPFVAALAASGYQVCCYNTEAFRPAGHGPLQFRAYPSYQGGYNTDSMEVDASYFKFGEVLADTA
ncbi:MAG: hypothetical protein ICV83_33135, partial [Cytophagales bacterium]|nr:hypothetical protein [Cytophagales bacterium]